MSVFWLIPAQDQLQDALAQSDGPFGDLATLRQDLSAALQETFASATAVIVIERINGYSQGIKNHVLRVEHVDQKGESHAAIVKFATGEKLAAELAGWQSCARPSNDRGVVLMPLRRGISTADGQPHTIVYEDAKQRLRAARLINLEDAVLTCCRWNDPECGSIDHVLNELFLELHEHIYERSHPENDPAALADELLAGLRDGISAWRAPHSLQDDCREKVMSMLPGSVVDLLDPLYYLPTLLERRHHLPEVMRGCAHGDLHGRNILVGIGENKATYVAVFDYEDMGPNRIVGWDFAKLETELKVRAYPKVFPGEEADFIETVYNFEQRLAKETLDRSKDSTWKMAAEREEPAERLLAVLIALRGHAMQSLAFLPQRSNSWLHEYYFLLGAYGLYAGKFGKTYGRRQFLSAFISAAAASAQHAWAKNASDDVIQRATARAGLAIQDTKPNQRPDIDTAESFHVPFAFAKEFCRSRESEFVTASIEILEALRDKFRYVLEIWQELALAHLELLDLTGDQKHLYKAKSVLKQLDTEYPYRSHYETLCRQGRLWKDCGDSYADAGNEQTALKDYEQALEAYLKAYRQERNYYPGINAATLYLLAGQPAASVKLAEEILSSLDQLKPVPDDELTWVLATEAEANLLLGNYEDAALIYEQAVKRPDCKPHHRSAMLKQVKRILKAKPGDRPVVDAGQFNRLFG